MVKNAYQIAVFQLNDTMRFIQTFSDSLPLLLKIFYIGLWGVCGCNLAKWCGFP